MASRTPWQLVRAEVAHDDDIAATERRDERLAQEMEECSFVVPPSYAIIARTPSSAIALQRERLLPWFRGALPTARSPTGARP
jgi:hypothetical protein